MHFYESENNARITDLIGLLHKKKNFYYIKIITHGFMIERHLKKIVSGQE